MSKYIKNLEESTKSVLQESMADDLAKLLNIKREEAANIVDGLSFSEYLELSNAVDVNDVEAAMEILDIVETVGEGMDDRGKMCPVCSGGRREGYSNDCPNCGGEGYIEEVAPLVGMAARAAGAAVGKAVADKVVGEEEGYQDKDSFVGRRVRRSPQAGKHANKYGVVKRHERSTNKVGTGHVGRWTLAYDDGSEETVAGPSSFQFINEGFFDPDSCDYCSNEFRHGEELKPFEGNFTQPLMLCNPCHRFWTNKGEDPKQTDMFEGLFSGFRRSQVKDAARYAAELMREVGRKNAVTEIVYLTKGKGPWIRKALGEYMKQNPKGEYAPEVSWIIKGYDDHEKFMRDAETKAFGAPLDESNKKNEWAYYWDSNGTERAGRIVKESSRYVWLLLAGAPAEFPPVRVPKSRVHERVFEGKDCDDLKLLDKPTMSLQQIAKKHGVSLADIGVQLTKGIKVELEHTDDRRIAKEIALDHLMELPDYYSRLDKMENDGEEVEEEGVGVGGGAAAVGGEAAGVGTGKQPKKTGLDGVGKGIYEAKAGPFNSKAIGTRVKIVYNKDAWDNPIEPGVEGTITRAERVHTFSQMRPFVIQYTVETDDGQKIDIRREGVRKVKESVNESNGPEWFVIRRLKGYERGTTTVINGRKFNPSAHKKVDGPFDDKFEAKVAWHKLNKTNEADNPYQPITPPSGNVVPGQEGEEDSNLGRKDVEDLMPGDPIEVVDIDGDPTAVKVKNPNAPGDTIIVQTDKGEEHIVKKKAVSGTPKMESRLSKKFKPAPAGSRQGPEPVAKYCGACDGVGQLWQNGPDCEECDGSGHAGGWDAREEFQRKERRWHFGETVELRKMYEAAMGEALFDVTLSTDGDRDVIAGGVSMRDALRAVKQQLQMFHDMSIQGDGDPNALNIQKTSYRPKVNGVPMRLPEWAIHDELTGNISYLVVEPATLEEKGKWTRIKNTSKLGDKIKRAERVEKKKKLDHVDEADLSKPEKLSREHQQKIKDAVVPVVANYVGQKPIRAHWRKEGGYSGWYLKILFPRNTNLGVGSDSLSSYNLVRKLRARPLKKLYDEAGLSMDSQSFPFGKEMSVYFTQIWPNELEEAICPECGSGDYKKYKNSVRGGFDYVCPNCGDEYATDDRTSPEHIPLDEVAPPGQEEWIKDRKAEFKKRYGDRWEEVLYATAWKRHNNESIEETEDTKGEMKGLFIPVDASDKNTRIYPARYIRSILRDHGAKAIGRTTVARASKDILDDGVVIRLNDVKGVTDGRVDKSLAIAKDIYNKLRYVGYNVESYPTFVGGGINVFISNENPDGRTQWDLNEAADKVKPINKMGYAPKAGSWKRRMHKAQPPENHEKTRKRYKKQMSEEEGNEVKIKRIDDKRLGDRIRYVRFVVGPLETLSREDRDFQVSQALKGIKKGDRELQRELKDALSSWAYEELPVEEDPSAIIYIPIRNKVLDEDWMEDMEAEAAMTAEFNEREWAPLGFKRHSNWPGGETFVATRDARKAVLDKFKKEGWKKTAPEGGLSWWKHPTENMMSVYEPKPGTITSMVVPSYMVDEGRKISDGEMARLKQLAGIKETASAGATGAGAVATGPAAVGDMQSRPGVGAGIYDKPKRKKKKTEEEKGDGIGRSRKE